MQSPNRTCCRKMQCSLGMFYKDCDNLFIVQVNGRCMFEGKNDIYIVVLVVR